MSSEAKGGADMAKMILGIVLIAAGNLLAVNGYPRVPDVVLPAHPGVTMPDIAGIGNALPSYFRTLMLSLLMVNLGAVSLYLSREPNQG